MKFITIPLIVIISIISLLGCATTATENESNLPTEENTSTDTLEENDNTTKQEVLPTVVQVAIEIADYGTITLELDSTVAPITVENFLTLTSEGFYDGLTFHRIITGFMIQGGCPLGTGTGGSATTIKGEFSSNGVENDISHVRGTISMARSQTANSASSQFFIVHEDSPHLNGDYAAFGHVISGMEIVDEICNTLVAGVNGEIATENQPVITAIRILE